MTRLDTLLLTSLALTFASVLREPPGLMGQATALLLTAWSVAHLGRRTGLWLAQVQIPACGWCEALMGGFALVTAAGLIDMPAGPLTAVLVLYAASVLATALLHRLEPLRAIALNLARISREMESAGDLVRSQPATPPSADTDAMGADGWTSPVRARVRGR